MAGHSSENNPYTQQQGIRQSNGERSSYSAQTPQEGQSLQQNAESPFHQDTLLAFSEKRVRMAFIRKVYSILTAQLTLTALIVVLLFSNEEMKKYVLMNPAILVIAVIASFTTLCSLLCCTSLARTTPINYVFLFIFTIAEGFLIAVICIRFEPETVLLALGITILVCFCMTVFAFQTTIDFTGLGMVLCIILVVFTVVGVVFTFFQPTKPLRVLYTAVGVLIFSFYLIYDTQLMMGGKHKFAFSPEDYVFATLSLYLDILNIFLLILQLLGNSSND